MANARNKEVDTTYLSLDNAENRGFIHRDYLAHCTRWSHVVKWLNIKKRYETARIIDVGCGRELPLAKLLYTNKYSPKKGGYCGVDFGPIEPPEFLTKQSQFELILRPNTDFMELEQPYEDKASLITCFEVIEHVEPHHMFKMLKKMRDLLADDGTVILSTPVYDEKTGAADNHVNEMSWDFLFSTLKRAGFKIMANHGTFASQRDIKPRLEQDGLMGLFEKLHDYYDSNVLSTIFAPLYPAQSRNALWVLEKAEPTAELDYGPLPFGSSKNEAAWAAFFELAG